MWFADQDIRMRVQFRLLPPLHTKIEMYLSQTQKLGTQCSKTHCLFEEGLLIWGYSVCSIWSVSMIFEWTTMRQISDLHFSSHELSTLVVSDHRKAVVTQQLARAVLWHKTWWSMNASHIHIFSIGSAHNVLRHRNMAFLRSSKAFAAQDGHSQHQEFTWSGTRIIDEADGVGSVQLSVSRSEMHRRRSIRLFQPTPVYLLACLFSPISSRT